MVTTWNIKNTLYLLLLIFVILPVQGQKHKKGKRLTDFTITQSRSEKAKGTQIVLKQVISDARCPEGVDCIWPGEAQVLVSIYQNKKWMDEEILSFSPKKVEDNKKWVSNTLAIPLKKIKSVRLLPYPKDSIKIDPKSYVIKVEIAK